MQNEEDGEKLSVAEDVDDNAKSLMVSSPDYKTKSIDIK